VTLVGGLPVLIQYIRSKDPYLCAASTIRSLMAGYVMVTEVLI
jgi:hypothetical protein